MTLLINTPTCRNETLGTNFSKKEMKLLFILDKKGDERVRFLRLDCYIGKSPRA